MRVKQTAKKISLDNEIPSLVSDDKEESNEPNSIEQVMDVSDNEVEFVVECRKDQQGNQFLLDGTPVIEPAAVDVANESKENLSGIKEISFNDFIKELQTIKPGSGSAIVSKKTVPSFGPNISMYNSVKCTACNARFNPFLGQWLFSHPLMEVILCKDCIQNQKDEYFIIDKDDNKETLCRWCVEGGSLICCDVCPKSFCKTCIKRNLGRTKLTEILNQDETIQWKCFICDPKPIEELKASCIKVRNDIQSYIKQKSQKLNKKPISRLSEIVNKKRPLAKAFPNALCVSPNVSSPKMSMPKMATSSPKMATSSPIMATSSPKIGVSSSKMVTSTPKIPITQSKPIVNKIVATGELLNNMASFGTEWYMRNVKLRNIFTEIDDINPQTLLNALNSTKQCVEAFYSDIRNLEGEISKASTASDITTVVSMFKSVYRHHIFNRFCQVKTRIEEDKKSNSITKTVNGKPDHTLITSAYSIPNHLTINNVVSTAQNPNISCRPNDVSVKSNCNTNISEKDEMMTSIDLTDDFDNKSDSVNCPSVDNNDITEGITEDHVVEIINDDKPEEVVDLCMDEDLVVPSYPVLNVDVNNPLPSDNRNCN